jgi:hypothetical protein
MPQQRQAASSGDMSEPDEQQGLLLNQLVIISCADPAVKSQNHHFRLGNFPMDGLTVVYCVFAL